MPPPYSKSQVDRAGKRYVEIIEAIRVDPELVKDGAIIDRLIEPLEVLEWWRNEGTRSSPNASSGGRPSAASFIVNGE
jgi:hypothetical protein